MMGTSSALMKRLDRVEQLIKFREPGQITVVAGAGEPIAAGADTPSEPDDQLHVEPRT
jgi:hypothetical protein